MPNNSSEELKIDVIMPCWIRDHDTQVLTEAAVESIRSAGDVNLIIVDNGSTLGGGYLREVADIYLRFQDNQGYPKAVNCGLRVSTADIICIANNDILVSGNVFKVARSILSSGAGSIHYRMIGYNEDTVLGDMVWMEGKERWCSSSFFCIHSKCKQEYDESYGLGGFDDWDYWHRFRHINGWKTAYTNKACYRHLDSHTQLKLDPVSRSESDKKNRDYFKSKFGEYPENIWMDRYPKQMETPWRPFP